MRLDFVSLLQIQRDLQAMPRDRERFRQYLRTILNEDGTDADLVPLVAANPMAKDHVTALLDALLSLDADGIGARLAAAVSHELADAPGEFKAALVVIDDAAGGWTNRWDVEYGLRHPDPGNRRFWVTGGLWSSETASEQSVHETFLAAAYRTAHVVRYGPARNLRELLVQEGRAMARAGCTGPVLDDDDLAYTREVIRPFLDAGDKRTVVECLFGDAAARSLGFTPRGLSPRAGLALALHEAC
jgi:hypothetical protein